MAEIAPEPGIYVPAAAGVSLLASGCRDIIARLGKSIRARARQAVSAGRVGYFRRHGGRPGARNIRARRRRRLAAGAGCRDIIARLRKSIRARAREAISADRVENLRRGGGRLRDGNIRARRGKRRRARPRTAVSAGRIDRRRARARGRRVGRIVFQKLKLTVRRLSPVLELGLQFRVLLSQLRPCRLKRPEIGVQSRDRFP